MIKRPTLAGKFGGGGLCVISGQKNEALVFCAVASRSPILNLTKSFELLRNPGDITIFQQE
jgi:hypothetical protein